MSDNWDIRRGVVYFIEVIMSKNKKNRKGRKFGEKAGQLRGRGRPREKPHAEPIPDTPENIARALLSTPPKKKDEWRYLNED